MKAIGENEPGGPSAAPIDDRLGELSRRIEEWLEESRHKGESVREILEQARREPWFAAASARPPLPAGPVPMAEIAKLSRDVESRADQSGILNALVAAAGPLASRVVLFVVRNEVFTGWSGSGLPQGLSPRRITLPAGTDSLLALARALCGPVVEPPAARQGNGSLAAQLGDPAPDRMMAAPIWVRDRVAALLYADASGDSAPWSPEAIGVMTSMAALALEALPWRQKHPRPAAPAPGSAEFAASGEFPAASPATGPVPAAPAPSRPPEEATGAPAAAPEAAVPAVAADAAVEEDSEEARLHEEARRFARLLVSEIVLYNEAAIEEGRRHKDLYQRLKDEIERSRQMYEQRVSPRVLGAADYFRQEVVRVLARGDESAIALPWA